MFVPLVHHRRVSDQTRIEGGCHELQSRSALPRRALEDFFLYYHIKWAQDSHFFSFIYINCSLLPHPQRDSGQKQNVYWLTNLYNLDETRKTAEHLITFCRHSDIYSIGNEKRVRDWNLLMMTTTIMAHFPYLSRRLRNFFSALSIGSRYCT